jgi:hypothetical protein
METTKSTERLTLGMSTQTAFMTMADGNPGAIMTILDMFKAADAVDPDNPMGGLGVLLNLDSCGIYGTDINTLYSDICAKIPGRAIMLVRAVQMGILPKALLQDACSRQDYSGAALLDMDNIYMELKAKLPRFDQLASANSLV